MVSGKPGVGRVVNGMGFNAVLRDYGRIGLMMLHNGKANGKQLLPESRVGESTVPEKENEPIYPGSDMGYQYQWWTLAEFDAYLAIGLQGQYIYIDPATDTVVVKLSYFPPGEIKAETETMVFFERFQNGNLNIDRTFSKQPKYSGRPKSLSRKHIKSKSGKP